jgi:hypothetical protein
LVAAKKMIEPFSAVAISLPFEANGASPMEGAAGVDKRCPGIPKI